MVFARIPKEWCDPEDALQHGMLIACQSCQGRNNAKISTFVYSCAFRYAWKQYFRKSKHPVPFSELQQPDQEFGELIAMLAQAEDDHSHLEGLDSIFIERIRERLKAKSDWLMRRGKVGKSPVRADRAIRILELLARNVEQDAGIGIDEYADRPTNPRDKRIGFANERGAVRRNLMQHFGLRYQDFDAALFGLCQTTDQVIRERGIY